MPRFDVRTVAVGDLAALGRVAQDPSLAAHFDRLQGEGLARTLEDPFLLPGGLLLAWDADEPVAFSVTYVFPGAPTGWGLTQIGVRPAWRRRGIARSLLAAAENRLREHGRHTPLAEWSGSGWVPQDGVEELAAAGGYAYRRTYWLMERPRGPVPAPVWPAGIEARVWDGSERELEHGSAAYNDAFADHDHFVPGDANNLREVLHSPGGRPQGYVLAWRGGECVGFSRNVVFEQRAEVGTLGTVRAARGLGLGRALLRWSVDWLQRATARPVTLLVHGENENALGLYRSEGFAIVRTRRIWSRDPDPA